MSWGAEVYQSPDGWVVVVNRPAGFATQTVQVRIMKRLEGGIVHHYGPNREVFQTVPEGTSSLDEARYTWDVPEGVLALLAQGLGATVYNAPAGEDEAMKLLTQTLAREADRVDKLINYAIRPFGQ